MSDNRQRSASCQVTIRQGSVRTTYNVARVENGWRWEKRRVEKWNAASEGEEGFWEEQEFAYAAYFVRTTSEGKVTCGCQGFKGYQQCKHSDYTCHMFLAQINQEAEVAELKQKLADTLAQLEESKEIVVNPEIITKVLGIEPKPKTKRVRTKKTAS